MGSPAVVTPGWKPRTRTLAFFALEAVCVAGFCLSMAQSNTALAAAFLFGPMQFLAWVVLSQNELAVLYFLAAMTPLAIADFVPHAYHRFILYPGTLALLLYLKWTWFVRGAKRAYAGLTRSERIAPQVLLVWLLVAFVHAVQRGWQTRHLLVFTGFAIEVVVLGYFFAVVPRSIREVRNLILTAAGGCLLAVVLLQFLPERTQSAGWFGGKLLDTPFGTLDLNHFGALTGTISIALLGLASGAKTRSSRAALIGATTVVLAALVITKSRGAWMGFGVAFLYVMVRARSLWLTVVAAGGGAVLLLSDVLRRLLFLRVEATSANDPSLHGRLLLWRIAWNAIRDNWFFGVGWHNFQIVKGKYGFPKSVPHWENYSAHNIYIEVLADLGIVGLVCFLWLLFGTLVRTDRLVRTRNEEGWSVALALSGAILAYSVHGLMDFLTTGLLLYGIWFGLAMAIRRLMAADGVSLDPVKGGRPAQNVSGR